MWRASATRRKYHVRNVLIVTVAAMYSLAAGCRRLVPERGPVRRLALLTLVSTTGNGVLLTLGALYYTRILGFSIVSVGAGLSLAAIAGLASGVPVGHLADRRGPREVLVGFMMLTGVAVALLLAVQTYWQFVLVASLVVFLDTGANTARNAMVGGVVRGADRSAARAYLRSIANIGITAGAGVAAIALHLDTRSAYASVMYLNAAAYVACGLLALGLPRITPASRTDARRMLSAARDLPFVAVTLTMSVLAMHYWIIQVAMPLWIVERTDAPRWMVSLLVALNTAVVVLGQVAVARRVATPRRAVTASAVSGLLLLGACSLFGLSGNVGPVACVVLLLGAALMHVFGEMTEAAASFLLSFELAPASAVGAYQGLSGMGMALSGMLAPATMALLPLRLGAPGWLALGVILLVAGLSVGPAVRWACATREVDLDPVPTLR
jgi:MFS family permease